MLRESRYLSVIEIVLCGNSVKSDILVNWKRRQGMPPIEELGSRRLETPILFFKKPYRRAVILSH